MTKNVRSRTRVLVVDDDERLAQLVERGLMRADYDVVLASSGDAALAVAEQEDVDVIVLDIGIPHPDGLTVLRRLRARGDSRPVMLLTGRRDVADRVQGLHAGADDYLPKPFAMDELLARVAALSRRWSQPERRLLESGGVQFDPVARTATRDGTLVELTAREFALLELFLRHPNQTLTHDIIRDRIWGRDAESQSNVVAVYISYLRAKIDEPFGRSSIQTLRGVGYRWDPEA